MIASTDLEHGEEPGKAICQLGIIVERCLETQITLYICFIDYTNAFDRIQHDMLFFEILSNAGVPDKEINVSKYLPPAESHSALWKRNYNKARRSTRLYIVSVSVQHLHGILDTRSTGKWRGNKHQWTKYHKYQICR